MQIIREPLENRNGDLYFDGISARNLAKEFDTPLYVISEKRIRENYNRLQKALATNYSKTRIFYAAKANANLAVLRILENAGASLDAVSPGEIFLALESGFTPERILFTGTSVRNDELEFALRHDVTLNVDSLSQLERLLKIKVPEIISVRVNPEIGAGHHEHVITAGKHSKFGLWESDALKAYETAKNAGVEHFGIHMHVGSGVLNAEPFVQSLEKLLKVARTVHERLGLKFEFIDIGGGLGVPYKPEENEIDVADFSKQVLSMFKSRVQKDNLGDPTFCVEPGRYLIADASVLLTTVNTIKTTPYKRFVGVDAGFNTLIRPTMYGSYHHILVANKLDSPDEVVYDVVGPICESGDVLAKDRLLPNMQEGDLLAVLNTGAYGFSMSSQYNARPRASEVIVGNGKATLARERERLDDLVKGQHNVGRQ